MAILCRSYNLLFIMNPRTACSAIGKALQEQLDGEFLPSQDILDNQGKFIHPRKDNTLQRLIEDKYLSEKDVKELFKFTCIRNPFDSLASLYEKKRAKYQPLLSDPSSWVYRSPSCYVEDMQFCASHSFDEWVSKKYKPSVIYRLLGRGQRSLHRKYVCGMDEIVRFENIQFELQRVLEKAGINNQVSLPYYNKTFEKESDYRKYYSEQSRKIVEYVFQDDFARFGYSF